MELVDRDFALCDRLLEEDSKNYHVWSYRQWAVAKYGAWARELLFVEQCIKKDVRNNSAWNQRFWIGEHERWWEQLDVCKREWDWAMGEAAKAPNNESPWLFMQGILRRCGASAQTVVSVQDLQARAGRWPMCIPLRALLVYVYEKVVGDLGSAIALCRGELATQLDTIHANYWNYKAGQLEKLKAP